MGHGRKKLGAAVAVTVALLVTGVPASATTPNTVTVTCGRLQTVLTPFTTFFGAGCGVCPAASTATIDISAATSQWNTQVTDFGARGGLALVGSSYIITLGLFTSPASTGVITPGRAISQRLELQLRYYLATGSCASGSLLCRVKLSFLQANLVGTVSALPGGTPQEDFAPGDTITLNGTGTATLDPPCTANFNAINGTTVGLSNLVLTAL